MKPRLGVLVSGSGTNLQVIIEKCQEGYIPADIGVIISNKKDAYALERAKRHNIPSRFVDRSNFVTPALFNQEILDILQESKVDYVIMAGYMLLLGDNILAAYPQRVLNIHPALLPSFPGAHGIDDSYDYGVKVGGITIHFADDTFDSGPIIIQEPVRISDGMTKEVFEEKIHQAEHRLYPLAIKYLVEGRLKIEGRKVRIIK